MATSDTTYSASYLAQSRAPLLNAFYSIPIALEAISTSTRIWAKVRRHADAAVGFDDYLMIFATVVAIAECISGLIYGAPYGLGRHIQALTPYDLKMYMKGDYIFSHFYDVAIGCTKLSVLALYYRLFSSKTVFRALIIVTAAFVVAWIVVMEVVLGFSCRPIQAFWGDGTGQCINLEAFTYFTNVTNLVTDLWIFAMPIHTILGLQASRDKKIGLCFLFSVGLGTCAISAARLSFVFGVASVDYTWNETSFGILSAWEPCGGILCANLPVVYGVLAKAVQKARGTMNMSNQRSTARAAYNEQSERNLYHDWSRLNHSGSVARQSNEAAPEPVSSNEGYAGVTEMELLEAKKMAAYSSLAERS